MERLTIGYCGNYALKELCSVDRLGEVDDCDSCEEYCKTANYDCDQCAIQESFNRLAKYEDLEEQGRLLKLPCAVGDIVYTIHRISDNEQIIYDFKIDALRLVMDVVEERFGKTVFVTKEEAEAALNDQLN